MTAIERRRGLSLAILALACSALIGCRSKETEARDAYIRYQTAAASNDMAGAQRALAQLVRIDDGVGQYWLELARMQADQGNTREAYESLIRAYELDRGNVGVLRALTELALREGDSQRVQGFARELDVVSPGDKWVKLTQGYMALRESRFDEVLKVSSEVLQTSPFDPHAKAMKARALIEQGQEEEAVGLLNEQIRVQPSDIVGLRYLAKLYERRRDWPRLAQVARKLAQLQPARKEYALLGITAAFRSADFEQGRRDSWALLTSSREADLTNRVLDIWVDHWPAKQRVADAIKLGRGAREPRLRLPYADFLNRVGSPGAALSLVAGAAKYPVSADTADANAVVAESLALTGKLAQARKRFDDVLAFDPDNIIALRGRGLLFLRTGKVQYAIADAEKLVTLTPAVTSHRLLLARVYAAANNTRQAERTLWDAFRDIPADERIYSALVKLTKGDAGQQVALREEFARQIATKTGQGLL